MCSCHGATVVRKVVTAIAGPWLRGCPFRSRSDPGCIAHGVEHHGGSPGARKREQALQGHPPRCGIRGLRAVADASVPFSCTSPTDQVVHSAGSSLTVSLDFRRWIRQAHRTTGARRTTVRSGRNAPRPEQGGASARMVADCREFPSESRLHAHHRRRRRRSCPRHGDPRRRCARSPMVQSCASRFGRCSSPSEVAVAASLLEFTGVSGRGGRAECSTKGSNYGR